MLIHNEPLNDEQIRFLHLLNSMGVLNADVNTIISRFSTPKIRKRKNIKLKKSQYTIYKECVVLPYCGKIIKGNCYAMKKNHGLYTQCNRKYDNNEYCKVCQEAARNSTTEKPPYGDIRDRGKLINNNDLIGLTTYGNVIDKLKIDKKQAEKDANRLGWTISNDQWEITKKKRGRPKKKKEIIYVEDTDEEDEEPISKNNPNDNATDEEIIGYLLMSCA